MLVPKSVTKQLVDLLKLWIADEPQPLRPPLAEIETEMVSFLPIRRLRS